MTFSSKRYPEESTACSDQEAYLAKVSPEPHLLVHTRFVIRL